MEASEFLKKVIAFASGIAPEITAGKGRSILIIATDDEGQTIAEMGGMRDLICAVGRWALEDRSKQKIFGHVSEIMECYEGEQQKSTSEETDVTP